MEFKPYQKELKLEGVLQFIEQMKFVLEKVKTTIHKPQENIITDIIYLPPFLTPVIRYI